MLTWTRPTIVVYCSIAALSFPTHGTSADDRAALLAAYEQSVQRGIQYLTGQGQDPQGAFAPELGPAVTSIAATALLRHGRTVEDPHVARALAYLQGFVQPDGGIYKVGSAYANYETSLAIVCFQAANEDGRYSDLLARAEAVIKKMQWDEGEGKGPETYYYGGFGYGKSNRPDLSNTSFTLDALRAMGRGADDEAIQRTLIFVSRTQNLESEYNTTPFAAKNPDGGFYYSPAAGGVSQAGQTDEGGLRSYASMTYAGLKSMIYAGLTRDDPRVKAAWEWIQRNYDLQSNPGLGKKGLYYYYLTFAKSLSAAGEDRVEDSQGNQHDWRSDLIQELASQQRQDGSWVNGDASWYEGNPTLVTAYSLLALSYANPALAAAGP